MGMSVTMSVDSGILLATSVGKFVLEEATKNLHEILRQLETAQLDKMLFDGREISGEMSVMDRFRYAEYASQLFAEAVESGKIRVPKIAYVLNARLADPNRFGENVAVNRGLHVKVFDDLDQAQRWIGLKS